MRHTLAGALMLASVLTPMAGHAQVNPIDLSPGVSAPVNGLPRTLSAHDGDTFNPMDYGALGDGTGKPIGTTYGANLAALAGYTNATGAHPFAFANDEKFGMTFKMTPSATSATATQAFLVAHGALDINGQPTTIGDKASVAAWQDPANGSYLVAPGMDVTGSCIGGTPTNPVTVISIDRTPGAVGAADPAYGTITLSAAPVSACSSSTPLTFTMDPSQVVLLTMDWLGWQAAIAQAYYAPTGGAVRAPQGLYELNHSLLNPGGITDSNQVTSNATNGSNIDVGGVGIKETVLQFKADLGLDMGAITESSSAGESVVSASSYHDFAVLGPANDHVNGQGNIIKPNKVAVGMDGLRVGRGADLRNLTITGFNAGVSGVNDHWNLHSVQAGNNACGVLFRPYTYTMGNQMFEDGSLAGNYVGSVCVSTTNQMDSSLVKNVHTGFGPRGFWYLPDTANTTARLSFLSNTTLIDMWIEEVGSCWICGAGHTGQVDDNVIISGGGSGLTTETKYELPNDSSGYLAPIGIFDVAVYDHNMHIGTVDNAYSLITGGAVNASVQCNNNTWIGDYQFAANATLAHPMFNCPMDNGNMWQLPTGSSRDPVRPDTLPGLKMWLSADHIIGAADASVLTTWTDLSGSGNAAAQQGSTPLPTYNSSHATYALPNGLPVVGFNGSQRLIVSGVSSTASQTTCGVLRHTDSPTGSTSETVFGTSAGSGLILLLANNDTNLVMFGSGGTQISPDLGLPGTAAAPGSPAADPAFPHVICMSYSPSKWAISYDGALLGSGVPLGVPTGTGALVLGGDGWGGPLTGYMGEVASYSPQLTTIQIAGLSSWLSRWGTTH